MLLRPRRPTPSSRSSWPSTRAPRTRRRCCATTARRGGGQGRRGRRHRVPRTRLGGAGRRGDLASTAAAVDACLAQVPDAAGGRRALSNQRESVVVLERTHRRARSGRSSAGRTPAPRRGAEALASRGRTRETVRDLTGLSLDPMFSAPKMRWLLDAALDGRRGPRGRPARHGRRLAGPPADRGSGVRHRGRQRLAHPAVRPPVARLAPAPAGALRRPALGPARGPALRRRLRRRPRPAGCCPRASPSPRSWPTRTPRSTTTAARHLAPARPPSAPARSVMTPAAAATARREGIATTLAWLVDGPPPTPARATSSPAAPRWTGRPPCSALPRAAAGGAFLSDLAGQVPDADGVTSCPPSPASVLRTGTAGAPGS